MTRPTIALLFAAPVRVPPLRLLTVLGNNSDVGYWETRRGKAVVDGVHLRAADTSAALAGLAAAGVATTDLQLWLATRSS